MDKNNVWYERNSIKKAIIDQELFVSQMDEKIEITLSDIEQLKCDKETHLLMLSQLKEKIESMNLRSEIDEEDGS